MNSTNSNGPVPTGSSLSGSAFVSSAGTITIGTLNEDRSSRKVGWAWLIVMTKVIGSGVSQLATLLRITLSMPTFL
jgi:hypothetical protein